jgi:hypothetical protein
MENPAATSTQCGTPCALIWSLMLAREAAHMVMIRYTTSINTYVTPKLAYKVVAFQRAVHMYFISRQQSGENHLVISKPLCESLSQYGWYRQIR